MATDLPMVLMLFGLIIQLYLMTDELKKIRVCLQPKAETTSYPEALLPIKERVQP